MMKFLIWIGPLLAVIGSPALSQTDRAQPVVLPNETIIRVKGEGTVLYKPEILVISIGVTTSETTAEKALIENNKKSANLIEAIGTVGIPRNDIRTSELRVEPEYSENDDNDEIIGWRAINTFTVKTKRIDEAGDMITLLFEAGGNTLDGPDFDLTNATKLEATRAAEARALAEAREQAEATAAALGMRISRTLLVSDSLVNFDRGGGYIIVTGSRMRKPKLPIEPGEIEIDATYSVEYALVPK